MVYIKKAAWVGSHYWLGKVIQDLSTFQWDHYNELYVELHLKMSRKYR